MNLTNHGPATVMELQAVGNFTMRSYYNLSYEEQVKVLEDPLAFCFALDRDNIRDTTVPDSLYFLPPGYEMVDGKLAKISSDNATTGYYHQVGGTHTAG